MVFGALLTVGCGEGMPSFGGAAPAETPPPAVEVAAPVVPLLGPQVVLNVDCAALSASPGFVREITLTGGDGVYSFTNGEPGKHRYEHWEMQVDAAGVFQVSGEYIEGTPDVKQVSFEGAVKAGVVEGQGKRGPRPCTLRSEQ
jgi:hypothetical protein